MTEHPRIISLLPSATEMICALGHFDQLVGVTHECDFPLPVRHKPTVVRNALPIETMTEREIDEAVTARLRSGLGLYILDFERIRQLRPQIIVTQSLCAVCAPSENEIAQLLASLDYRPRIVYQTPHRISEVFDCLKELGRELGSEPEANRISTDAERRLANIVATLASVRQRPRVFCMEWLDPVYCSGHWVPEMVRLAGGEDLLGREGVDSIRTDWQRVRDWAPEILVFMPCGYNLGQALERVQQLVALPGFGDLPAARDGRVYVVHANAYFARPGPRLVAGAELMAHLIHPELFGWEGPEDTYRRIETTISLQSFSVEA